MAKHRHTRDANARTFPRAALVAAPLAFIATASAVTLGVVSQDTPQSRDLLADSSLAAVVGSIPDRSPVVSRARSRADSSVEKAARAKKDRRAQKKAELREQKATLKAVDQADARLWTTEPLNLWTSADESATKTGVIDAGERVLVTGREQDGRIEIVVGGESRWVTAGYLDDEKPMAGIGGDCTNGSSVPGGVDPDITLVHRAVCARFPEITSYGTFRSDGEHGQGRAVDVMVSGDRGWEVAEYLRANYVELGIEYLIYAQKIWSVDRGGEGWRAMSDRGSVTANHYDHVHVTVF